MFTQLLTRTTALALLVVALFLMLSIEASAQRQGTLTITNNATCAVTICGPKGANCVTISPGSNITVEVPCGLTSLNIRICGQLREIALSECISNANIGSCCASICYVPGIVACTSFLLIDPSTARCPCPFDLE